jgi:hypothetical protein
MLLSLYDFSALSRLIPVKVAMHLAWRGNAIADSPMYISLHVGILLVDMLGVFTC